MASVVYNELKRANAAGEIDLNADDIRGRLVMSNTTCDTENDGVANISDFTTVDACDDTGYSDFALANELVRKDDANDRAEFDADDASVANNGDASRNVVGVLIYKYVDGTDANDIPCFYLEFTSPVTLDGATLNIQWDAEGLAYFS